MLNLMHPWCYAHIMCLHRLLHPRPYSLMWGLPWGAATSWHARAQAAEQQPQEEVKVKNETSDLYTEEDLIKVNLEIETLSKSIVELKAKKKDQFLELKAMLTAERKRQKRAAEEAAERHRQLALAAASAAESLQVENAPMRAMMANKSGNPMPLNNHGRPKQ